MRPLPWPRVLLLATCVSALHWWAIDRHEAVRPSAVISQSVPPVVVMSATSPPQPADAEQAAAGEAVREAIAPPRPARAVQAPAPRVATAPEPVARPAFQPAAPLEATMLPVVLQAEEPRAQAETLPPPEPVDASAPGLLAQASPVVKPAQDAAGPASGADPPVPTYRTRPPAAATLDYRLSRGAIVGTGRIEWRPVPGGGYSLQLEGSLPLIGTLITQVSRGRLDPAGLAPERHTDRRLRRGEQAANFDRATGRISFSGQAPELPLTAGVQDRVSVMIQLPAIVNAWPRMPPVGEHVRIRVVGARGDSHVWSLRFEGTQGIDTPDGRVSALRFLRESEGLNDTRAEFWLDPARQYLPAKVVLTDGKGDALELLRTP